MQNQENHIFFKSIFGACSFFTNESLHTSFASQIITGSEDEGVQEASADCLQNIRKLALACEKFRYQHMKQWMYLCYESLCIFEFSVSCRRCLVKLKQPPLYNKENTNKRIKGFWCASSLLLFELQTFRRHWTTSSRETQCTKVPYFVYKFNLMKNLHNLEFKLLGPNW